MRSTALVLCLALLTTPAAATSTDEVTAREASFYAAFLDNDLTAMAEIFADNFLYQHGSGVDFDEDAFLTLLSGGAVVVTRADAPDLRIVDYGETVVTSGVSRVEGRVAGDPFAGRLRFVNVWHREEGAWRLAHRNSQFID